MEGLESSNTSLNGKDILKAPIPGKTPIKHMLLTLIKLYYQNNPLQRVKGQLLSISNSYLPTWQSSRSLSLLYPANLSFFQTIKTSKISSNLFYAPTHTQPTSSISTTLVGSAITLPIFAKSATAATTDRLARNQSLLSLPR